MKKVLDTQDALKQHLVDIGVCAPPQGKPIIARFKSEKMTELDGETFMNADPDAKPDSGGDFDND